MVEYINFDKLYERFEANTFLRPITINKYIHDLKNFKDINICCFDNIKYEAKRRDSDGDYLHSITEFRNSCIALNAYYKLNVKKNKELIGLCKDYLLKLNVLVNDKYHKHKKTLKQDENWLKWTDIMNTNKDLKNTCANLDIFKDDNLILNSKQKKLLKNYLIYSLYTLQPPRRTDYSSMLVFDEDQIQDIELDNNTNYLITRDDGSRYYIFNKHKTSDNNSLSKKIDVNNEMNIVFNYWLKYNNTGILIPNRYGNPTNSNSFSKYVIRLFQKYNNKKIGINMLRNIYITDNIGKKVLNNQNDIQRRNTADLMGHNPSSQYLYMKK